MSTINIDTDLRIVEPPAAEPLDLTTVRLHRKNPPTAMDDLFTVWIAAARQEFEDQAGIQLITATWDYFLDSFPQRISLDSDLQIELPRPPLVSVQSVSYQDGSGDWQTFVDDSVSPLFAPYDIIASSATDTRRGRLVLRPGYSWPTVTVQPHAVRIRFVAGFGSAESDVPAQIRGALLQMVGTSQKYAESVAITSWSMLTLPQVQLAVLKYKYLALPQLAPPRRTA